MKRQGSLDGIRGILLFLMTINHLVWMSVGQTKLQYFTLQPFGQVGAAEGFILLSGLLAGMVYSSNKLTENASRRKAWWRAFTIYKYHIIVLAILVPYGWCMMQVEPSYLDSALFINANFVHEPLHSAWLSLLLLNRPAYLDILPLYVLLMLFLPLILAGLRRNLWWLALAISGVVWASSGHITIALVEPLYQSLSPNLTASLGYFDFFAWQFIFVVGVTIGYFHRHQPINWYPSKLLVATIASIAFIMALVHHSVLGQYGLHQGITYPLADKPEMGWLRVVHLFVWVYLIGALINRYPNALNLPFFSFIGKHSLQVFAWQSLLIFFAAPTLYFSRGEAHYDWLLILFASTLWIPAKLHQLWLARKVRVASAKTSVN
ncbi:OpgC domain-containing protein [Vibrio tapetis]|uniref:OpgC protein n=1 Tax=Vibrio tapetis subsp. tapetis TaxID=1671868 RepID=A0A2N8ZL59_9VIBR